MIRAMVSLGGAHPAVLDQAQREDEEQIRASQYLLGLRRPDAIEAIAADDFAALEQALEYPFLREEDREAYRRSWRVPRAVESALHWYEVEGIAPPDRHGTPGHGNYAHDVAPLLIDVPTMVIYPEADPYVRPGSHAGLDRYVRNLTFRTVKDGAHWIAEQHPELVSREIREFLAAQAAAPGGA